MAHADVEGRLEIMVVSSRMSACLGTDCVRVHSWTSDGRRVCWNPGAGVVGAVDAESRHARVPASLARRYPLPRPDFWVAWTRAEVHAKLLGVPILSWLKAHGLGGWEVPGIRTATHDVEDLVVTVGRLESAPRTTGAGHGEVGMVR